MFGLDILNSQRNRLFCLGDLICLTLDGDNFGLLNKPLYRWLWFTTSDLEVKGGIGAFGGSYIVEFTGLGDFYIFDIKYVFRILYF